MTKLTDHAKDWTPEPWGHYDDDPSIIAAPEPIFEESSPFSPGGKYKTHSLTECKGSGSTSGFRREEDAVRAVSCVNAMAGVKDPQAFIDAARELYQVLWDDHRVDRHLDCPACKALTRFEAVGGKA